MLKHLKEVLTPALLLITAVGASAGPITINSIITQQGSLFKYDYSVVNGLGSTAGELLSVTLSVPMDPAAVQNLTSPLGFSAFFDPALGLVDFVEDTLTFTAGSTVSGFSFRSPFHLTSTNFSALVLDTSQNLVTFTGVVSPAGVPEPASAVLLIFGTALLIGVRQRLR